MSLHVPYRRFNRSQKFDIGGNATDPTTSVFLNVDSPRIQRDLARHSAIGALQVAGVPVGFTSDGYLVTGGQVTKTAVGSLNLTVAQAWFRRAGATVDSTVNGVTNLAVAAGSATGPRIDVVAIDTNTPALVVVGGTATANANLFNRLGLVADLPANRIPIALVLVPTSAANLDAATIVPLR